MKRRLILYAFCCFALAGMLTACSEDLSGNAAPSGDNRVSIASATVGTATRAATDATEFQINDMISLSTDADGTNAATYTFQEADGWNSTDPLVWGNTLPVTYYAAYPATATYNDFTLPADQSGGTAAANYMTATAEAQQKEPLALAFEHRTAQVVIKITGRAAGNEGTLSAAKVCSPHSRYEDGAPAGESLSIIPQTVTPAAGEEARYTALVLPGTADGFKLFSVNVGGKEVSFTTDIAFEENRIYEYTLAIGTERVTLAGFTAKEWTKKDLTASMTPQWDGQAADSYDGGNGSNSDPYRIATPGQLALFAKQVNDGTIRFDKYIILTSDIDLGGSNWTPIGNDSRNFCSHFDGQGHTIRNLYINQSEITDKYYGYSVGLFGEVEENASIRNLTVEHAVINITTDENGYCIGVIAGKIYAYGNAIIDNCHVAGAEITYEETDNRNTSIGGIAGYAKTNSFLNSITFSRCTVDDINVHTYSTSGDMVAGGICGWVDGGQTQIYACSASGTLTGRNTCGLALCNNASILAASGCYANCTLQGNTSAAISILLKVSSYPIIQWSYLAGLQSDALRRGEAPNTSNGSYPTKEEECHLVTDHSEVYGIVANPANETTFTVDGTTYYVRDCWQGNGSDLPT